MTDKKCIQNSIFYCKSWQNLLLYHVSVVTVSVIYQMHLLTSELQDALLLSKNEDINYRYLETKSFFGECAVASVIFDKIAIIWLWSEIITELQGPLLFSKMKILTN